MMILCEKNYTALICLLIQFCFVYSSLIRSQQSSKLDATEDFHVFLTVSSLANTSEDGQITQRQLELNWYSTGESVAAGDTVCLYDHDPLLNPIDPLTEIIAIDYPSNSYRTPIMFPRVNLSQVAVKRQCLGFWVAYVREGQILTSNCLQIQPNWMEENQEAFAALKLRRLMIPATHDAGSYMYYEGFKSDSITQRWVAAQEEDFWEQMMYGVRDFDLRVSYYENTPEIFWLNHGGIKVNPFSTIIDACKKFLQSTNEILVLDFHGFPLGFDDQRHLQLITYVTQELGSYMLPPSVGYDVTLDLIWRSGKRLVVAYSDQAYASSDLLWPGIPQIWANTMDIDYLKSYMDGYMNSGRTDLWSAQLELTETTSDVLFSDSSLRIMAEEVNANVTQWCRDLWWDDANIVALDYFLGSDIVQVAIQSNLKRSSNN